MAAGSFYHPELKLGNGDFDSAYEASAHKLEGELSIGGQEHFYMETQCCLVNPLGEKGEMEIFASTQCVNNVQKAVSEALRVPKNEIVAKVKRTGM